MNRRHFIAWAGAGLATSALAACLPRNVVATAARNDLDLDAATFAALRRFAPTSFGDIAYVEAGEGDAALFLHGFPLNGFQWRGALARLSPYRRCIAPDFMALGHTRVAAGQDVGPRAQAAMLIALLDALGIASVDVVANDSGGAVAQLLLVHYPQRVRTLLLSNCDTEPECPPPALLPVIELARQGRFADDWLGRWREDKMLARSADGIGGMCYADAAHPTDEAIEAYFAPLLASPARKALLHAYAIALAGNSLAGTAPVLKRSRVPTRVLWGTADTIFSSTGPQHLAQVLGDFRGVRRLAGSKLFWPEERPDVVAEEARRLWGAWAPQRADRR
jgi:haloalkane dehalogenase